MIFGFQLGESFGSVALKHYRESSKNPTSYKKTPPNNPKPKKHQKSPRAFQISLSHK